MKKQESVLISIRMPKEVHDYYTELADSHEKQWQKEKKLGHPPSRNWFFVQALALRAGFEEAVDWRDED